MIAQARDRLSKKDLLSLKLRENKTITKMRMFKNQILLPNLKRKIKVSLLTKSRKEYPNK